MRYLFYLCIVPLLLSAQAAMAQVKTLKMTEDLGTIVRDKNNAITKATVQAETEKTFSVQVEYVGFKQKDKSWKIRGVVLNARKTQIEELGVVEVDLDPKAGLADFFFTFQQKTGKKYPGPTVESAFIQFSVIDKNSAASKLGEGFDEYGLSSKVFTFEYKKKWKLKGVAGQEVSIKLTPFKSAAQIKQ